MYLPITKAPFDILVETGEQSGWHESEEVAEEKEREQERREVEESVTRSAGRGAPQAQYDSSIFRSTFFLQCHCFQTSNMVPVPVEVTSMIFEFACTGPTAPKIRSTISCTCRTWRDITRRTLSLWASFYIAPGRTSEIYWGEITLPFEGALTRLVPLQQQLALCPSLLSLQFDIFIPLLGFISPREPGDRTLYDALLSTVLPEHARIDRLRVWSFNQCHADTTDESYCIHRIVNMILEHFGNNPHPILRELDLAEVCSGVRGPFVCGVNTDLGQVLPFPNLEVLKIDGKFAQMIPTGVWAGLTELALTGEGWEILDVTGNLAACSRLERLAIAMPNTPLDIPTALTLPSLRSLHIFSILPQEHFNRLPPLCTPGLQHLRLRGDGDSGTHFRWEDLVSLLDLQNGRENVVPDITCLDLLDVTMEADCLDMMVERCSRLVELAFKAEYSKIHTLNRIIDYIQQPGSVFSHLIVTGCDGYYSIVDGKMVVDEGWDTLLRLSSELQAQVEYPSLQSDNRGRGLQFRLASRVEW
jgi:hypothetical protein